MQRRTAAPYLLASVGLLVMLAGVGLFLFRLGQPNGIGLGLGVHLTGWVVMLSGLAWVRADALRPLPATEEAEPSGPEYLTIEEGLAMETPRTVHFRPSVRVVRACFVIALVGWLLFSGWKAFSDIQEIAALRSQGKTAQAQVINNVHVTGYVNYAYYVEQKSVTGRFPVPQAEYPNYPLGKPLAVTYLPTSPKIHRLGDIPVDAVSRQGLLWAILILQVVLSLGAPFAILERRWQRERRLARDGTAARAVILESTELPGPHGTRRFDILYRFFLPDGNEQRGRARLARPQAAPLAVGDTFTLFYEPAHPDNNRPLEAFRRVQIAGLEKPALRIVRYDV